jgi:hypothetical protein
MKLRLLLLLLLTVVLAAATPAFGQECTVNLSGDWEAVAPGAANPNLYHFGTDGIVTVFSSAQPAKELGRAAYKLDDLQAPKTIEFKQIKGTAGFPIGFARMEISHLDDAAFTLTRPGSGPITWKKKDPYKYFVILAAHRGTPPHNGGPAFAMLVKSGENKTEVESFGLYYHNEDRINGPVPEEVSRKFTTGHLSDQDTILRLQVTSEEFTRSMGIVRTWQRRAREKALLFPEYSYLNVIVPMKEIAESLNRCGETINLYKLTWMVDDELATNVPEWELAFQYIKKLRQLNEPLHITDDKFKQSVGDIEHSQMSAR